MVIKNALRLRAKELFASAALQTLYSEYVEQGKIYCIQHVAWEINKVPSGGNTRVRLFIAGHGYNHSLEEQQSPAADNLYTWNEAVWLIPGERLAIEIDQAQAATTAEMIMTGYWTELKEGMI